LHINNGTAILCDIFQGHSQLFLAIASDNIV
jgi:hypothetical protein